MLAAVQPRGFGHFACIVHDGEFTVLKWDDGSVPVGAFANLVFLHDRVVERLLEPVLACAAALAENNKETGKMYALAAHERLALIDQLQAECERRLRVIQELEATRASRR
jgi:hypothetical protein